jgi:DNA-directed RNA polymerase specialized sigma24 family protein
MLESALRKLPEAQRVPLVLYQFVVLGYEEIAELLGASISKVKTEILRARISLRRYLRPGFAESDRPGDAIARPGSRPTSHGP